MNSKPKLKIEDSGIFAAFIFNTVVGVCCLALLALVDFGLIHIGLIGATSLATAYGLFKRRIWAFWSMFAVAIIATVFAASTLYYTAGSIILLDVSMAAYMALTWIFTAYVASRRSKLEL